MNEQTGESYSFCPQCGTLMENGVCPECAKKSEEKGVYSSGHYPKVQEPALPPNRYQQEQPNQYGQNPYQGQQNPYGQNVYQGQSNPYGQNPYQGQQNSYNPNMYQPGGYYGQNYQNSGYGQYNLYMQPKKDNKVWVIIGIIVAVLVLLGTIIGSFFYGYFLMKLSEESEDIFAEEYSFDEELEEYYEEDEEGYGYEPEEDYVPSAEDEYYYGPCDSINTNVPYSFIDKTYTNEDPDNDIDIVIHYLELKGEGIPNLEKLNEALETEALYYVEDFAKDSYMAEYGESFEVYISSYVTYNDENIISIVMDEYVAMDDLYHIDLYPINLDVKNGVVLDNESLLQIDEDFAKEFRKRNNKQNGNIEYLDSLSDEEVAELLQDEYYVIAYYTPLGMEIGMNYSTDTSGGWVTVTYKDYEKYLKKF